MRNIIIENYDVGLDSGIEKFMRIENLTLILTKEITGTLVFDSINIVGVFIEGADTSLTNRFSFSGGAFYKCYNITNVWVQYNLYDRLFFRCSQLNNLIIVADLNSTPTTDVLDFNYLFECDNVNNINFYAEKYPNNVFINSCHHITNVTGLTYNQISNSTYDINNSWNLKKCLANDVDIPTSVYISMYSLLKPQYLHVHIKDVNSRIVTEGVDFNADSAVMGSYGFYKFIYNTILSRWELHQLGQDRDIDGGYVNIRFTINENSNVVYFYFKSQSAGKSVTVFTDELK